MTAKAIKTEPAPRNVPSWMLWLRCVLVRRGHAYGRWWWPDRAEAHCLCDECADMRTPENRHSWVHRERQTDAMVLSVSWIAQASR